MPHISHFRYGFNSQGHSAAKERLRQFRCDLKNEDVKIGVNLGKNKASSDAAADYVKGVNELGQFADYLVINVSRYVYIFHYFNETWSYGKISLWSPNTPGLRALQSRKALETLISQVLTARDALETPSKIPVLLKVAPDLTEDDKVDIVNAIANPKVRMVHNPKESNLLAKVLSIFELLSLWNEMMIAICGPRL